MYWIISCLLSSFQYLATYMYNPNWLCVLFATIQNDCAFRKSRVTWVLSDRVRRPVDLFNKQHGVLNLQSADTCLLSPLWTILVTTVCLCYPLSNSLLFKIAIVKLTVLHVLWNTKKPHLFIHSIIVGCCLKLADCCCFSIFSLYSKCHVVSVSFQINLSINQSASDIVNDGIGSFLYNKGN